MSVPTAATPISSTAIGRSGPRLHCSAAEVGDGRAAVDVRLAGEAGVAGDPHPLARMLAANATARPSKPAVPQRDSASDAIGRYARRVIRPRQVIPLGLIGLMCIAVAAPTSHDRRPIASISLPGRGRLSVDVATAQNRGTDAWGYVELRNSSDDPIQIVAMTSEDGASVTWTTARHVVTISDLYSAGSVCSVDRVTENVVNRQARAIRDLVVPARGTLSLRNDTDHVTISGLVRPLFTGAHTQLELYLDGLTTGWTGSLPVRLHVS